MAVSRTGGYIVSMLLSKVWGLHHRTALFSFERMTDGQWNKPSPTKQVAMFVAKTCSKLRMLKTSPLPCEPGSFPPATGFPGEMAGDSNLPCPCMLHRVLIALIKHHTKINLERKGFISPYSFQISPYHWRKSEQELKTADWRGQRPWKNTVYWLPHGLHTGFSHNTQKHLNWGTLSRARPSHIDQQSKPTNLFTDKSYGIFFNSLNLDLFTW